MKKDLQRNAKVLLGALMLLLCGYSVEAQPCTGGTMAGTITPTIPWQTIPCITGGEYYEFSAVAGDLYTFTFCMAGGNATWDTQITILDNSGAYHAGLFGPGYGDDECLLQSDVRYWSPAVSGTYRVLVTQWNCQANAQCGELAYKRELQPNSPGSTCANPSVVASLPFSSSGLSTCFQGNTESGYCGGSTYTTGEEYIFTYNGTAGECISVFLRNTFTYTAVHILDNCPSNGGTCLGSDEASAGNPTLTNVTLPSNGTYYIVVDVNAAALAPGCTPFDIDIVNCVAVGQGNTCANAFPVPSIPYTQVGFTTCGYGDDYDNTMACGSNYMDGDDFVFSYTAAGPECLSIELTGTGTWTGFFVLDGCPDLPASNCIAMREDNGGNPKLRNIDLPAAGTYYIVVSTWPSPQCTPFNIDIQPCGPGCTRNPNANDNCATATAVTIGLNDTVCGFTNMNHTLDASADLNNEFCGSIENNSWFSFVADSTQMTLQIEVSECLTGFGIQGQIFQTSNCNQFTPVSNCWNPMIEANGIIRATGLTVGNTYLLMLDGYAGDDCLYQITRVTGGLPIEWGAFTAVPEADRVRLNWQTYSEVNNFGFYVQRGTELEGTNERNAVKWENVGFVPASSFGEYGAAYEFFDEGVQYTGEPYYYRLQQMDHNGTSDFSEVRMVQLEGPEVSELLSVYPNPTQDHVSVDYYAARASDVEFRLFTIGGQMVLQDHFSVAGQGTYKQRLELGDLPSGLYLYQMSLDGEVFQGKLQVAH